MGNQRYDQLITDLRGDYRPQREWGVGSGILMVIGHFLVGIAGGTWVLASIYDASAGLVVAFVLGGIGALAHLAYLGWPRRALGMMRHWRTSWVSRGFIGFALFLVGGTVSLGIELFLAPGASGALAALAMVAKAVAMVGAIIIIGYMGFCYTASKAIPFWHSPLHPALYIAYAFRGGIAVLLVIAAIVAADAGPWLLQFWVGVIAIVALFFALEIQGALASGDVAARWSVRDILAGRLALLFYGGTLVVGLVVPLVTLAAGTVNSPAAMAVIGLASAAGDFFMKLATVRAGVYRPLVLPQQRRQRA